MAIVAALLEEYTAAVARAVERLLSAAAHPAAPGPVPGPPQPPLRGPAAAAAQRRRRPRWLISWSGSFCVMGAREFIYHCFGLLPVPLDV